MARPSVAPTIKDQLYDLNLGSPVEIGRRWAERFGTPAPSLPRDLLVRTIAHNLQVSMYGDLPAKIQRRILAAPQTTPVAKPVAHRVADVLRSGTRLVRSWGGNTYTVVVEDDGFLMGDRRYTSLSQIATDITGTKWSGPRFFGLTSNKKAGADA